MMHDKRGHLQRDLRGSVTLQKDKDYTVTASFDDASVGSGKNVTATVTLMGQAAKNYALEQSSSATTGSITKQLRLTSPRKLRLPL